MRALRRNVVARICKDVPAVLTCSRRSISVNTGINKGLRQDAREDHTRPRTSSRSRPRPVPNQSNRANALARMTAKERRDEARTRSPARLHKPISIHHTTAASQFIRDERIVLAMLKSSLRRMHRLYISNELNAADVSTCKRLARAHDIKLAVLSPSELRGMEAALFPKLRGAGKAILECSPPPEAPLQALEPCKADALRELRFSIAPPQSAQTRTVSAKQSSISLPSLEEAAAPRHPFLIWLHGVTNIGNIGAVFRSAAYLGADGILLTEGATGSLTSGVLDASAGSSDAVPVFRVRQPTQFIAASQANGWRFLAAQGSPGKARRGAHAARVNPLETYPTVVILGEEHAGLDAHVVSVADGSVTVPGRSKLAHRIELDSLNVSVAGAIIMQRFLSPAAATSEYEWQALVRWARPLGLRETELDVDEAVKPAQFQDGRGPTVR